MSPRGTKPTVFGIQFELHSSVFSYIWNLNWEHISLGNASFHCLIITGVCVLCTGVLTYPPGPSRVTAPETSVWASLACHGGHGPALPYKHALQPSPKSTLILPLTSQSAAKRNGDCFAAYVYNSNGVHLALFPPFPSILASFQAKGYLATYSKHWLP